MDHQLEYRTVAHMLAQGSRFGEVDNVFAVAHFSHDSLANAGYPMPPVPHYTGKFPGIAMLLILDGELRVEINSELHHVTPNSVLGIMPGSLVRILHSKQGPLSGEAYVLYLAPDFLPDININYGVLGMPASPDKHSPVARFDNDQIDLLKHYFRLLLEITRRKVSPRLDRNIAASIISALIYQINQLLLINMEHRQRDQKDGTRPSGYVHEFMHLVQLHYMRERSVQFYADKLHISPKYLSLLVRKATGRSASRWIDERVVMEARNLLRFSDKNVQQVAYMLNFTNQSTFGKYFKHLTGMSPTEYQKS